MTTQIFGGNNSDDFSMGMPPQGPNIKITEDDMNPVYCDKCRHDLFQVMYFIRKVKGARMALKGGPNKDQIIPIQVFACGNCGHVNDELGGKVTQQNKK